MSDERQQEGTDGWAMRGMASFALADARPARPPPDSVPAPPIVEESEPPAGARIIRLRDDR